MRMKDLMELNFLGVENITYSDLILLDYQDNVSMIRTEQVQGVGIQAQVYTEKGIFIFLVNDDIEKIK